MKVESKGILMLSVLLAAAFFAIILSYYSISRIKSNLKASLICKDDRAFLKLTSYGDVTKIFYVSITKGDEILLVKRLDITLRQGDNFLVDLGVTSNKAKVSILFDKGIVSGLKCGITKASEP